MKCPKCATVIEEDSKFCKSCGETISRPVDKLTRAATPKKKTKKEERDVYGNPAHEKLVWQGRPAWRSYWGMWFLWLVASVTGLILAYSRYADKDFAKTSIWLIILGTAIAIFTREALVVFGLSYRLTTQRLFITRGILATTTDQMELMRIDDIRLCQGVVDRIVNTGTIEIMGTDETDEDATLESIGNPAKIAESLRLHIRGVRNTNTLRVENI